MEFDGPREPEQRQWYEDGADIGEGKAEFGFWDIVVAGGEGVVDAIDFGD